MMAIGLAAAMAWHMFDDRQHAPRDQALTSRTAQLGNGLGILAIGAVANDVVSARFGHIQHRQTVDGDAERAKVMGQNPRA